MKDSKALRYSVLANAASHMAAVDEMDSMQQLSLTYYSQSIRGLIEALATGPETPNSNAGLMGVMLLYLHGI
jgi:hypothetical protein